MTGRARLARALELIARLPLLGEPELARLIGIDVVDARGLRFELERRGWIEWFIPGTYALSARRLSVVREEALPQLASAFGMEPSELSRHLPVRRHDTLQRMACLEITARTNRFLADLAASPGLPELVELADARSLPLALSARERWWPPGVHGYGCLRAGELWAPFFLAVDRVAAPDEHRRALVAGWAGAAEAIAPRWGAEGLPVVLLVCAGERERAVFEGRLVSIAERGDRRIDVLLTSVQDVEREGPAGVIWRQPGSAAPSSLIERLGWGREPALPRLHLHDAWETASPPQTRPSLREWAPRAATDPAAPALEHAAAVVLATDRDEKRVHELIAQYPLVTARDLAYLAGLPPDAVERRLDWLLQCRVIAIEDDDATESAGPRHCRVTQPGVNLLALRAAAPVKRFGRFSPLIALEPGKPVRHREHLLGVHRVFARLAEDALAAGGRLVQRRNEAASTRRFRHDGRTAWTRPDGSGVVEVEGSCLPFLLEYDRGTLDRGDLAAKLGGYRAYFATEAWRQDFETVPLVLFVCTNDQAERRVAEAVCTAAPGVPVRLTTEWRYECDGRNPAGLLGPIWRDQHHAEPREVFWPRGQHRRAGGAGARA